MLKMEVVCSLETSDDGQQTIWRYISEDNTLQDKVVPVFKQYTVNIYEGGEVSLCISKFPVVEGEWSASCLGSHNLDMLKFCFCHNCCRISSFHISYFVCVFCCNSKIDNYILMGHRSNCKMY
jgi:hypothetical protein